MSQEVCRRMVKFKIHKSLESLVEYKKRKRQNIKKIIPYLILGATIYVLAYNCEHRKPKLTRETNMEVK